MKAWDWHPVKWSPSQYSRKDSWPSEKVNTWMEFKERAGHVWVLDRTKLYKHWGRDIVLSLYCCNSPMLVPSTKPLLTSLSISMVGSPLNQFKDYKYKQAWIFSKQSQCCNSSFLMQWNLQELTQIKFVTVSINKGRNRYLKFRFFLYKLQKKKMLY